MKKLEKTAVFLVSLLLTLIGFNLIAAPAIQILKIARLAGHQVIADYLSKNGVTGLNSLHSMGFRIPVEAIVFLAVYAILLLIVEIIGSDDKDTKNHPRSTPGHRNPQIGTFGATRMRLGC